MGADAVGGLGIVLTQIYTHVSNADIEKAMEQNPLANLKAKKE